MIQIGKVDSLATRGAVPLKTGKGSIGSGMVVLEDKRPVRPQHVAALAGFCYKLEDDFKNQTRNNLDRKVDYPAEVPGVQRNVKFTKNS